MSATKEMPRIKETYQKQVVPRLLKERSYASVMAVPRLTKVVVNMGVGEATQNIKLLDAAMDELGRITGQRPAIRRAQKSIAAFRLREGMPIAATVTLRGDRMYEFVDRLFNVALPRVRDFRGVPTNAFDGRGNYTLGLQDQIIFPEIDYAKVDKLRGHERDLRDHRPDGRGVEAPPRVPRHAVPEPVRRQGSGQAVDDRQGEAQAEVRGARVHPLPPVRAAPRLHSEVRDVPDLLP